MSENRKSWLWLSLALLLVGAMYAPAMRYGFLDNWDDGIFIIENRHLKLTPANFRRYGMRHYRNLYTPLPMYSLMLDRACFGLRPAGYHLHNLALHLACTAMFFVILRRLGMPPPFAALAGLIWALNPQKNESVIWVTERKDVLMGVFFFAAILCFMEGCRRRRWQWDAACAVCTVCAIFCKPAAVPLIGIFPVWLLCRRDWRQSWRHGVLIPVAAGVLATIWAAYMTAQDNPGTLERNVLVWIHNVLWYPMSAVTPLFNTNPIYPAVGPAGDHLALLTLMPLAILALAFYAWKVRGIAPLTILAACLLLGGTILPVVGLWHYTAFEYCDRYNYLVSAVAVAILALLIPRNRIGAGVLAAIAVLMMAATWLGMPEWRTDESLARACLERPGRLNPKAVEVAASDAFHREDAAFLSWIARRIAMDESLLGGAERKGENTVLLLQCYAAFLDDRDREAKALLSPLLAAEERSGKIRFLRGANYRLVYKHLKKCLRQ